MSVRFLSGVNVDSNTLVVDDVNNRVGIGTASPGTILEISSETPIFRISSSLNSSFHGIEFRNGGSLDAEIKQLPQTGEFRISNGRNSSWGGFITLYTDTAERMRITAAGNVGIGTTSPYSPFQVGNYTGTGGYARGSVATFAGAWDANLPSIVALSTDNTSTINKGGGIGFGSGSEAGSSPYIYAQIKGLKESAGGTYNGYLAFYTTPTGSDANTERMRINGSGNVGIGTTAPNAKLNINTDAIGGGPILPNVGDRSGISLTNSTAAASGAQQLSPTLKWTGKGWKTNAPAASQDVSFISYLLPIQGASNPGGNLIFASSINGGSYTTQMTLSTIGALNLNGGLGATSGQFSSTITNLLSNLTTTAVDGVVIVTPTAATAVIPVRISPRLRLTATAWNTGGTPASNTMNWTIDNLPVSGNPPTSALRFNFDRNGGGYSTLVNFNSSGNVGIGITSPTKKLQIAISDAAHADEGILLQSPSGYGEGAIYHDYGQSTGLTAFKLLNTYAGAQIALSQDSYSSTGSPGSLRFYTAPQAGGNTPVERMRIASTGNVGVGVTSPANKFIAASDASATSENSYAIAAAAASDPAYKTVIGYDFTNDVGLIAAVRTGIGWRNISMPQGSLGLGVSSPTQKLHVSGNVRVTGAYYDSNNEAGTSGQVLSSTGSGTDWVTPATTTATSLYDLLPAARVAYNWTGQVVNDTWVDIFSAANNILTTGTWMVQMYISDWAQGGQHYTYTYTGTMQWYQETVNQGGESAASEIYLHRMGHAANASVLYLRTTEMTAVSGGIGKLQVKANYSNTSNTTINFKFVKIF
jgi:hypothetical protein